MPPTDRMVELATKADLQQLRAELHAEIRRDIADARSEARRDLEIWGGALRAELKQDMTAAFADNQRVLLAEMSRIAQAVHEAAITHFAMMDDKYADLPPRVSRLEAKVFPPRRARKR